jgi:hypothetical protein
MPSNFDYFLNFFRKKIIDGERQVDIASSDLVNRSTAYINKLYKGNPKSCPIDTQRKIAQYFGLTYDEMIQEGKNIYLKNNPLFEKKTFKVKEFKDYVPSVEQLIAQLNIVATGLKIHANTLIKTQDEECNCLISQKKLDLYDIIFANIDEGILFFNSNKEFVFSSNLYGFLDNIDILKNPSLEKILSSINDNVTNVKEAVQIFNLVYKNKKRKRIIINCSNKKEYLFRLNPVFKQEIFLGVIIIHTLKKPRK